MIIFVLVLYLIKMNRNNCINFILLMNYKKILLLINQLLKHLKNIINSIKMKKLLLLYLHLLSKNN